MKKIILASQSPRRKEILENLRLDFDVIVSDIDESVVSRTLPPEIYVQELAVLKAGSTAKNVKGAHLVIGADTIVVFNNEILGKPKDDSHAFNMLKALSGHTHIVYTGVAVLDTSTGKTASEYEKTEVTFKSMTDYEINDYIKRGLHTGKAGSYGVQDRGSLFVENINGDFFNVVGLPVYRLSKLLKDEFDFII